MVKDGLAEHMLFAFWNCSGLTAITLPAALNTVESWAFGGCGNITEVVVLNANTNIEDFVFDEDADILFRAPADSSSRCYAEENGFSFSPLEESHKEVFEDEPTE